MGQTNLENGWLWCSEEPRENHFTGSGKSHLAGKLKI